MIKALIIIVCCFFWSMPVNAQLANEPLPEAPFKINLPHSDRTKDNVADAVLDFLLTKAFTKLKDATVTYDFFELKPEGILKFTNFNLTLSKPYVSGNIFVKTMLVDAKELLALLNTRHVKFRHTILEQINADLIVGSEKEKVVFKSDLIDVSDMQVLVFVRQTKDKQNKSIKIGSGYAKKLYLSARNKIYKANYIDGDKIKISVEKPYAITFDRATADGKEYIDFNDLMLSLLK